MSTKPTLRWNDQTGEGSIGNLDRFRQMDWIYKADALVDWICELKKEYKRLFDSSDTPNEVVCALLGHKKPGSHDNQLPHWGRK